MPRLSFEWLHACCGCEVSLLDAGDDFLTLVSQVEIVHCPLLLDNKYQRDETGTLQLPQADIGLVSGGVASEEELELVQAMRASCTTLIALGTCATHGGIPAMRNQWTTQETLQTVYAYGSDEASLFPTKISTPLDRVYAVDEHVQVDWLLPGCPPTSAAIVGMLTGLLDGNPGKALTKSVCETCPTRRGAKGQGGVGRFLDNATGDPQKPLTEMVCLLEQGILCMGPVTSGGCGGKDAPLCLRARVPCRGCYGPVRAGSNPLLDMLGALASNGIDHRSMIDRKSLLRFSGAHGMLKPLRKRR
ncbi:methyl viologen-reducing hydrogenase [Desulfobulbus rhabdoformis]|nr:methyl viologen-reducing hydrogenase [Desulfobulbus rhabdoformis]